MFLARFDPASIDPRWLVNRKEDFDWIVNSISECLRDPDRKKRGPLAFCVHGEKGVGKSILTRAAILQVRRDFSDDAIFVEADCRHFRSAKAVIDGIAANVVEQLDEFRELEPTKVTTELMATAQALSALTRLDNAQLKVVHQHLAQFKAATSLKGGRAFLRTLKLDFQISLDLTTTTSQQLSGEVTFDALRLCKALAALLKDIHDSGIDVVVYIDNMDEVSHYYRTDSERQTAAHETETLLLLREAPIIFIVNMRTYYQRIVQRKMSNVRTLDRLPPSDLHVILHKRLEQARPEIRQTIETPAIKRILDKLAKIATTPLAFLVWFKVLFEADALSEERLDVGITKYLANYYGTLPAHIWRNLAQGFLDAETEIDGEALLAACGGDNGVRQQVVGLQGVLPKDFWDPTTFYTLDPELHIVRLMQNRGASS